MHFKNYSKNPLGISVSGGIVPNNPPYILNPQFMDAIIFLRQLRFGGYAIFDLVASLIGMALLAPFLSKLFRKFGIEVPRRNWVLLTLPLALVAHVAVGRYTLMTRDLFDPRSHFFVKFIFVLSLALGLMDIKRAKREK